jgi:CubicO group peptidase (beta-lactamase class C family)
MRFLLLCVFSAVLAAQPLPLSTPEKEGLSAERLKRLHAAFEQMTRDGSRAGAITMIVRNGRIADWHTYGYRDLAAKLPMEKDTIGRMYSMTKVLTSVAALALVEEGKLALNDPVDKYVPELKDVKVLEGSKLVAPKSPMRVRHLMTHTAGYIYGGTHSGLNPYYNDAAIWEAKSLKDFIGRIAKVPLVGHPGEGFVYGMNTDVLGYVVQVAADVPFEQVLETRVFKPLKMNDTYFVVPEDKRSRIAKLYQTGKDGKLEEAPASGSTNFTFPGGGHAVYSTLGDYARFAQMLANGGELEGVRILGRKTVELMTSDYLEGVNRGLAILKPNEGFGLGVSVRNTLGGSNALGSAGDFGWSGAATTYFRVDPKEKAIGLLFLQHLPIDGATVDKFSTLWYQALQ